MKRIFFIGLLSTGIANAVSTRAIAQEQTSNPSHATSEDSTAMNALVLYPANIRKDIFEACEYSGAIVNIASLQKKTSNDFALLIGNYSKEEQENFWNLSRYPDLITDMVQEGKKSKEAMNTVISRYPADIRDAAMQCSINQYDMDVLQRMAGIHAETNAQFAQTIADYPAVTQNAFRELIQYPEIMSLLNEHLDMTVRVGDHYRRNPQEVLRRADERNKEETKENAEDTEEWKQNMEQNPDEATDLKDAAADYAAENGYSTDEINTVPSSDYVDNYTCEPYSFWFGYPTWYPYNYWYPYPFWFDCGFYYGAGGHMVFIGHPSYYFTNWYFHSPEHMHRYPHLGNTYINHYYGKRRHVGGSDVIVRNWVRDNKEYLPKDFTTNKTNRVEAIRQVGQLNEDARKAQGRNSISPAEKDQYYQKNAAKYPVLNANHEPVKDNTRPQNVDLPELEKQPSVRIPKQSQEPVRQPVQQQPAANPAQENNRENREPEPVKNNFDNIQRAQEYHRNVWEGSQPASRPQAQPPVNRQPQQRPQSQPQRQSAPPARPRGR